jgi:acyl-CoA thioester hydrolase
MMQPHQITVRVYYHASYLRFMERGRTEQIRDLGVAQAELFDGQQGLAFAVRRMTIDFLKPARMDDLLTIETQSKEARGATLVLAQRILRGEDVLVTAEVMVACVGGGRARRIPDGLRKRLGLEI